MIVRSTLIILALCAGLVQTVRAELLLSAPPRETAEAGRKIYGPLADLLSETLGEPVRYEHPYDWPTYTTNLQEGRYDFVFDGPHFAAWRIARSGHVPLVRLPEPLRFYVATRAPESELPDLKALLGGGLCTMPAPNLTALVLAAERKADDVPPLTFIKGGNGALAAALWDGKCRAAVLRDQFADRRLSFKRRNSLRILFRSRDYPNQTLTAGPRIPSATRAQLIDVLTRPAGREAAKALLERFAGAGAGFVPARARDYLGAERLLAGPGWE
jgi:ABC-type phosphate/phosphonate transport system substrate-binding protein